MKEALLISIVSNRYQIFLDGDIHVATAMGKLRLGDKPLVGDRLLVDFIEEKWVIQKVINRKNQLVRPFVANVDQALIVMSLKEPDFSYTLVDRLIFLVGYSEIEPILVLSKADLVDPSMIEEVLHEYRNYKVIVSGHNLPTKPLEDILKGKLSVLAGQSGVGKSSILNRINENFKLNTQEISKALGRGKHTTRHNQLYDVAGGWIADTPGFSSLDFSLLDKLTFSQRIPDFQPYDGQCRYRDCKHLKEPGCKVKEMVEEGVLSQSRYDHYVECFEMIKEPRL